MLLIGSVFSNEVFSASNRSFLEANNVFDLTAILRGARAAGSIYVFEKFSKNETSEASRLYPKANLSMVVKICEVLGSNDYF